MVHFEILTPLPLQMKSGVLIDYRLRLYSIPLHWQSEICVWEPPHRFVDRQIRGPYRVWIHKHIFTELNDGTLVARHSRICDAWRNPRPKTISRSRSQEDFRL